MAEAVKRQEWNGSGDLISARLVRHRVLLLIVVLPTLLAVMAGWMQPGRSAHWPLAIGLAYYSAINIGTWVGAYAATWLLAPHLTRLRAPFWLILLVGFLAGCHLGVIAAQGFLLALRQLAPSLPGLSPLPQLLGDVDTLLVAVPIWFLTHMFSQMLAGWPTYGHPTGFGFNREKAAAPPPGVLEQPKPPAEAHARVIARLKPAVRGSLLALRSEQNYVRVFTDRGEDLILASLAGLAAELGASGVQVHRSWWVCAAAVAGMRRGANGRDAVELSNGLEVPIGRTFRREAFARLLPANDAG